MPKERQTCTECSMRRQKCDRQIPCSRCVKRGEADKCTREWPEGGYNPRVHRVYPGHDRKSSEPSHDLSRSSPTSTTNGAATSPFRQYLHTSRSFSSGRSQPDVAPIPQSDGANDERRGNDAKEAASTLEFISWGKSKLSDYDLKSIELTTEPLRDVPEVSNGFGATTTGQVTFLQMLLPSTRQVFQLVEYHIDSVLWYHACLHGPTFYQELQAAAKQPGGLQIKALDLRWAALLFSIMAGSLVTAPVPTILSWGFQRQELSMLTRQWFKATVSCLNLADYMWRHHLYSVEAILILIMSAHLLGYSTTMTTLLGTALKISQGLGLHRLGIEDDELPKYTPGSGQIPMHYPSQKHKIVQRERGRRLWAQLCNQDWFGVQFFGMYSIQPTHFTTSKPRGLDDKTLKLVPDELPLGVRFISALNDLAAVCAQMYDAVTGASTVYTKYEQVVEYDAKLRSVANLQPTWLDSREPLDPHWPEWVPWARRSFNLCFYHKIIVNHKEFLGRSFKEPAFDYSRRACLASSKSILREAKQAYDEEGPSFWIDQAFMVAAGIVLSLDTFHRQEVEPEFKEHRRLAETTVGMLGKFENSAIGQRGAKMLSSLLAEQARLNASSTLDISRKHHIHNGMEMDSSKKQKFDVPKFVEQFIGDNSFTSCLKTSRKPDNSLPPLEPVSLEAVESLSWDSQIATPGLEKFEQLFPPQSGMSNSFLFEDLLIFEFD